MALSNYFIIFAMLTGLCVAEECNAWQKEFSKDLAALSSKKKSAGTSPFQLEGRMSIYDPVDNMDALFHMWAKEKGNVELYWWKSDGKTIRAFIMMLYLCLTTEPVSYVPNFLHSAGRFEEVERKQRLDEYNFVLKNRGALAKHVLKLYEKYSIKDKNYNVYKNVKAESSAFTCLQ